MNARTVLFMRHGQTQYNAAKRIQGQQNIPLNAAGIAEAQAAAQALAAEPVGAIVSSDLQRATATARKVSATRGVPLVEDARFRERGMGQLEHQYAADLQHRGIPVADIWVGRRQAPPELGIEPLTSVVERFAQGFADAVQQTPAGTALLVVSHGAAIRYFLNLLLGQAVSDVVSQDLANTHWCTITSKTADSWALVNYNVGAGSTGDHS